MADKRTGPTDYGSWLIAITAALGLAVSAYSYFSPVSFLAPDSDIAGTPGAILVVGSTAILLAAALILAMGRGGRALRGFLFAGAFLGLIGTAFAGYLLNSQTLFGAMLVGLLGWFIHLFTRRKRSAAA